MDLWWAKKTRPLHEILTRLVITEKTKGIFSNNQSCQHFMERTGFFGPTKVQEGLQHHIFLIFDGKEHPENIWFHGC